MSTNPKRVRIVMPQHGKGEVWLDDVKVEACFSVAFRAGVGQVNHLTLETIGHPEVTLEGVAQVDTVVLPAGPDPKGPGVVRNRSGQVWCSHHAHQWRDGCAACDEARAATPPAAVALPVGFDLKTEADVDAIRAGWFHNYTGRPTWWRRLVDWLNTRENGK
jgi:hypothetical protein